MAKEFKGTLIRSGGNAKTVKGDGVYETAIMYLAPAHLALGNRTVCSMAVLAACINGCLFTAGKGGMNNVKQARINKTKRYFADRAAFMAELVADLEAFVRYCARKEVKPAVRLNGTSDIIWEAGHPATRDGLQHASIMAAFPEVQFYDYTKVTKRALHVLPSNYSLTLSYSESNPKFTDMVIDAAKASGLNVAVVYRNKAVRDSLIASGGDNLNHASGERFMNRRVIDGDRDDLRFMDERGVIVGLYAKGQARKDYSGFVIG